MLLIVQFTGHRSRTRRHKSACRGSWESRRSHLSTPLLHRASATWARGQRAWSRVFLLMSVRRF